MGCIAAWVTHLQSPCSHGTIKGRLNESAATGASISQTLTTSSVCLLPAAHYWGHGMQGPAIGADIYQPWDDTVTQVPVNPTLWAASTEHYYTGVGNG